MKLSKEHTDMMDNLVRQYLTEHRHQSGTGYVGCALRIDLNKLGRDIGQRVQYKALTTLEAINVMEEIINVQMRLLNDVECQDKCTASKMRQSLTSGFNVGLGCAE